MSHHIRFAGKKAALMLTGDLTVRHAEEMRAAFVEGLNGTDEVSVEFAGVTAADVSFLQLLCSVHRTAVRLHKQFTVAGPRPVPLVEAAATAWFGRRVGCKLDSGNSCLWTEQGDPDRPKAETEAAAPLWTR